MTDTTHEAPDLLPCPFCGGQAEVAQQGTTRQSHVIACTRCGCLCESGETGGMRGNHWNTRADTTQAAVAAALTEVAEALTEVAEADVPFPSHESVEYQKGWDHALLAIHKAILALITPNAQSALDRMLADRTAERDAALVALKEIAEQTKGVTPEPDNLQIAIGSLHSYARSTLAAIKEKTDD